MRTSQPTKIFTRVSRLDGSSWRKEKTCQLPAFSFSHSLPSIRQAMIMIFTKVL